MGLPALDTLLPEHVSSPAQLVIIVSSSVDRVITAVRRLQAMELGVEKSTAGSLTREPATLKELVTRIGEVVWTTRDMVLM